MQVCSSSWCQSKFNFTVLFWNHFNLNLNVIINCKEMLRALLTLMSFTVTQYRGSIVLNFWGFFILIKSFDVYLSVMPLRAWRKKKKKRINLHKLKICRAGVLPRVITNLYLFYFLSWGREGVCEYILQKLCTESL